ncbi:MAG: hypothetical protein ACXIUM_02370 [Wenzhouxiangella sp.]
MTIIRWSFWFALLVAITSQANASSSAGFVAQFCNWCTTPAAAQQKAWALSPTVECNWPGGYAEFPIPPDLHCWSWDRQVLLINPHTGSIYSYQLTFDPISHSHVLSEWALPADLLAAAETVLDIHQALFYADFSHLVEANDIVRSKVFSLSGEEECPQGTALDHVLNPAMRQWMTDQLHQRWWQVSAAFDRKQPRVSRSLGVSASVGPVTLTVGWENTGTGVPIQEIFRAGFIFSESEVSTAPPLDDVLVFDIHEFNRTDATNISMNMTFNEGLSRAAGQPVNLLLSGQTTIDNPCVLQKLDDYVQSRPDLEFREGGPGGPPFEFPAPPDPFQGYCSRVLCARTCVDGVCTTCQFNVTVLVPCV